MKYVTADYEPDTTNGTKTVAVQEEDLLPKVTIGLVSGAPTAYDEGESVAFEISASTVTTPVDITVYVMLADDDTGDFLADATTDNAHPVVVSSGSTKILNIPTVADTVDEGTGGMITATVQPDPNQANRAERTTYLPGVTDDISVMASITDNDDDTLPSINIAADQTAIYEGDTASFTVSTEATLSGPVTVLVDVIEINSGTGDFIDGASNTFNLELVIPQATGEFTREFTTVADATDDDEGTLSAMIKTDTEATARYSVGANHRASITLQDNDDDNLPSITISKKDATSTTDITEGADAVFTVSAADPSSGTAPTEAIMVMVQISQVGNFLPDPTDNVRTVSVMSGASADLTVMTDDDNYDDLDSGRIIAKVLSDMPASGSTATYSVGATYTAMIGIADDDDMPEASISATYSVSDEGNNDANGLVVMLTPASGRTVQVAYAFADGTGDTAAEKGTDYSGTDGTLTFIPDETTGITPTTMFVPFSILKDAVTGVTKTFTITLSPATDGNATVSNTAKVATVTIEYILPEIAITAGPAVTDGAGVKAMFTITSQLRPRRNTLVIDYTPVSTTFLASADSDTKVEDHTLNFSGDGPYTASLEIPLADVTPGTDGDGNIMVTLNPKAPVEGYTVASAPANSAMVTVYDDDALPTITIAATYPDEVESATPIMIELSATGLTADETIAVNFTPSDVDGDFLIDAVQSPPTTATVQDVPISVEVQFTDPDSDDTYTGNLPITLQADQVEEISAPIQVTINADPAEEDKYKLGATTVSMIKILDDDAPELTITAGPAVTEGDGVKAVFTVSSVVNPGTTPIMVDYTPVSANYLADGVSDTPVLNHPLTFSGDGPYTAPIEVDVENDTIGEVAGEITVTLNQRTPIAGYTVLKDMGSASVTVTDDDGITLSIDSASLDEGALVGQMTFTVMATPPVPADSLITVNWSTSIAQDDNATAGSDFTDVSNQEVEIKAGEATATFTVAILGDDIPEPNETFTVTLSSPSAGVKISTEKGSAKGTITNDDGSGLRISAAELMESGEDGSTNMVFMVSVIPPSSDAISYSWATSDDTGEGAATAGDDYTASSGTDVPVAANATSSTFSVPILDDDDVEGNETFTVTLSNAKGAKLLAIADNGTISVADTTSVKGTIVDDDALPVVTIAAENPPVMEGDDPENPVKANFELTATNLSGDSVTLSINATPDQGDLDFLVAGVSGVADDFEVVFTPTDGVYTGSISLDIVGDEVKEDSGEITLTLNAQTPATTYELGTAIVGEVTIVDNDYDPELPRVGIALTTGTDSADGNIDEGQSIDISISADEAPSTPISVVINVEQDADFIAFRVPRVHRLTTVSDSFSIHTNDDTVNEDSGYITVTIVESDNSYTVDPTKRRVRVLVTNDDLTTVVEDRISVANLAVNAILNLPQFSVSGEPTTESSPAIELPKVSVAAVTPVVDEGAPVRFNISGSGNLNDDVVVGYTLTPEGDFYDNLGQGSRWVSLSASKPNALVEIATIDDTTAERDGALTLTLLDGQTYDLTDQSSASVAVSDSADRQQRVEDISSAAQDIQAEMTGALGARTLGFTSDRISNAFASKGVASTFMYNGKQDLTELIEVGGDAINGNSMTLREVLGSSSFAISLFPETDGPSMATIWGLGDYRDISSAEGSGSGSWDADVFTGHLGLDAMVGHGLLVGISAAVTESDIDHTGRNGRCIDIQIPHHRP